MTNYKTRQVTIQRVQLSSTFSTTSASFVDITGLTITLPSDQRSYIFNACLATKEATIVTHHIILLEAGSEVQHCSLANAVADIQSNLTIPFSGTCNGQILKLQTHTAGSVSVTISQTADHDSWIETIQL